MATATLTEAAVILATAGNWQLPDATMTNDPIILALEEQVDCYRRLAKLAEVQHEHVTHSHTEGLLEVLARRQEVLSQLGRLEEIVSPAKKRWGEYLGGMNDARRAAAEELLLETRRLLQQITESDQRDALVLQQRKLNLGKQIQQASNAKQVNRNYAAAAYGAPKPRMNLTQ